MNITEIKVRKLFENGGRLLALVSVTIDECLAIHDIKVIDGPERPFAAMPSRKETDGVYRDIVHPITSEARKEMEQQILKAYEAAAALAKMNLKSE